jgi:hypothetical protein
VTYRIIGEPKIIQNQFILERPSDSWNQQI